MHRRFRPNVQWLKAQLSSFVWNTKFLSHFGTNTSFCFSLILVFARVQHSRQFSAHPPKLLILQSAIPPEQAVDRTFSDQQLGRPTVRRHNRKTTPSFPHPLTLPFHVATAWGEWWGIVVVDLFSSLSHREEAAVLLSVFWICADAEVGQRG